MRRENGSRRKTPPYNGGKINENKIKKSYNQ